MPKFPFTNYHELNLDWILKKVTALFDASEENAQTIRTYNTRLTAAEQTATNANTAATAAQQLADAASENADDALSVAGTADAKADNALTAATNAAAAVENTLTIAQAAQQTAGAAVATANDAAATASSLESLANTANQNATAALETAQTADQKAVAAQTAATTADQKAVAAQSAATTNAGNISTLQTDVSNLNRQLSELDDALDNKADVIIDSASGSIASFADGANDMQIRSLVVNIEPIQAGSGNASPTNIRPITGHTECNIIQTGANIWDEQWELGIYNMSNGLPQILNDSIRCKNRIVVKPGISLYCTSSEIRWLFYNNNDEFISSNYGDQTMIIPANAVYMRFYLSNVYGASYGNNVSINYPSTDTEYHPYTGNQISVTFPTEADTVYGAILDITTGVFTVNWAMVTINGSTSLQANGATNYTSKFGLYVTGKANGRQNILSNLFSYQFGFDVVGLMSGREGNNFVEFSLPLDVAQTITAGQAWFADNPTQLMYELANPQTYQLTPQQLNTLLGTNNIYSYAGSIADVQYPADTKLYIDGKIAELQALVLEN